MAHRSVQRGAQPRGGRYVPSAAALLESLENRVLLAADLTGSFAPIPGGTQVSAGGILVFEAQMTNQGDVEAKKAEVSLYLSADDTFDPQTDVLIAMEKGKLAAGETVYYDDADAEIPENTPAGTYRLIAVIDEAGRTDEDDETNNVIVSDPFEVLPPDINLAIDLDQIKLPGTIVLGGKKAPKGSVKALINNLGTASVPKGETAWLDVYLRPTGAVDDSQDMMVGRTEAKISGLSQGKAKKANVKLDLTGLNAEGSYKLVAVLDQLGQIADSDTGNNEAIADQQIDVAFPFIDVSVNDVAPSFNGAGNGGAAGKASVLLENLGTDDASGTVDVAVYASLNGLIDGNAMMIGQSLGEKLSLKGGTVAKKPIDVDITLPDVNDPTDYHILAMITPSVADAEASNNTDSAGVVNVTPTPPFFGLFGSTLTFAMASRPIINGIQGEEGSFVDSKGQNGLYQVTFFPSPLNKRLQLFLTLLNPVDGANLNLEFKSRPDTLEGLSLRFFESGKGDATFLGQVGSLGAVLLDGQVEIV